MKTHIVYHANCADGFGAAFAAWLKLGGDLAADRTALEQAGNDRNYAPNAPWAQYEKSVGSMMKRYAQDPQPPAKKPEPEKKPSRPTIEEPWERMMSIPFNTED